MFWVQRMRKDRDEMKPRAVLLAVKLATILGILYAVLVLKAVQG